ncbi:hypothetical protein KW783_02665 [Candidatus Parcubacteria bacterium]|nr:hypothetical protein [Candidatus Parcubacteria bacterium]
MSFSGQSPKNNGEKERCGIIGSVDEYFINMDERLLKPYSPKETENRIYKLWNDSGFFNPTQ